MSLEFVTHDICRLTGKYRILKAEIEGKPQNRRVGMLIVALFLLYLTLPLVELAFIIVLAVMNSQKKQKIAALNRELEAIRAGGGWPAPQEAYGEWSTDEVRQANAPQQTDAPRGEEPGATQPWAGEGAGEAAESFPPSGHTAAFAQYSPNQTEAGEYAFPVPPAPQPPTAPTNWQGTVALVVGVVFVILAGMIFATTAWRVLPDLFKVALVMAFSGIFFGASAIADRRLHIRGTSKAFHILGSIFLFVAVLAVGFFGLLGSELTLTGYHRYLLLLAGTLLTELALLAGLKKFPEIIYGGCCLWGFTVAAALLTASFHPGRLGFALGMACYGLLVTAAAEAVRRRKTDRAPAGILRALPMFATVNLWGISALVLIVLGTGPVTAMAAFLMAGVHLYLGLCRGQGCEGAGEMSQAYLAMFSLQMMMGLWRLIAPETAAAGLYTVAAGLVLLAVLERAPVHSAAREALRLLGAAVGLLLLGGVILAVMADGGLTVHGMICMGLLTLDITLEALRYRTQVLSGLHSLMTAAFLNYCIFYLPLGLNQRLLTAALVFAALYLLRQQLRNPLSSLAGEVLFTLLTLASAGLLFCRALLDYGENDRYLLAALAVLAFAAAESWSRRVKPLRQAFPLAALGLPVLMVPLLRTHLGIVGLGWEEMFLAYLILFMAWDILKQDFMQIGLLALGCCLGAAYFLGDSLGHAEGTLPFYLVTAAYLAIRGRRLEGGLRTVSVYGVYTLVLAGVHAACYPYLEIAVQRRLGVLIFFAAEYLVRRARKPARDMERFFQIGFAALYGLTMAGFYRGAVQELAYLPACLAAFAAVYALTYRTGDLNLHLLAAAVTLWLPAVLSGRYHVSADLVYGGALAFLLVFGGLMRMKWKILENDERQILGVRADWFCVLAAPALLIMGIAAPSRSWLFACILAGIACTLQYAALKPLRKAAFTISGALAVTAFWAQPFYVWPEVLRLEIRLIPAAVYIWSLAGVWGKRAFIYNLQTALYSCCLLALAVDALLTGRLTDALILEGICLAVLVLSCAGRCRRWAFISGGTALGVALYVTRGFWLSISWWVYLLAAGIGLILFAAHNEMKKR